MCEGEKEKLKKEKSHIERTAKKCLGDNTLFFATFVARIINFRVAQDVRWNVVARGFSRSSGKLRRNFVAQFWNHTMFAKVLANSFDSSLAGLHTSINWAEQSARE